jgi:hypothetical protein
MSSFTGYTQVYGGNPDNYYGTDFQNAHNFYSVGGFDQGVQCVTCHSVHAAENLMTLNPYLTQRLLIGKKSDPLPGINYDPIAGVPAASDTSETALTKWCAGCHWIQPQPYGYYDDNQNGYTHVMTTATASYNNPAASYSGRVAWDDSFYCSSCHASEFGDPGRWPHYTNGMRFLESGGGASLASTGAVLPEEDGVCLRCHRDTASTGIGYDY